MALVPCEECGKSISDAAKACPNCGRPQKRYYAEKDRQLDEALDKISPTKNPWAMLVAVIVAIIILYYVYPPF